MVWGLRTYGNANMKANMSGSHAQYGGSIL